MTEEQKEFWLGVGMHLAIALFVAIRVLPFVGEVPRWLVLVSTVVGATGGLLMATHAMAVHRLHRPSIVRGMAEGAVICLLVYAVVRQIALIGPYHGRAATIAVMLAVPAWFAAYAVYMLVETRGGAQQASRF